MAGHRALAAVGRSLVTLLNRQFLVEIPTGRRPTAVMVGTDDLDQVNSNPSAVIRFPAVSLYCYRLTVDGETRAAWSAVASFDGLPRLPLCMHIWLTAWDEFVESELEWLGLAMRTLESESILTGPQLDPSGDWDAGDAIQIVPDHLALDSMSEAFEALTADFRLSMPYVARVIRIDGRREAIADDVATVGTGLTQPRVD
jgi:hypothetical protein